MNPKPRALRLRTLWLRRSTSTSNCTQIAPFNFANEPRAEDCMPLTSPTTHPSTSPVNLEPRIACLRLRWLHTLWLHRLRMSSTSPRSHPRITLIALITLRSHWSHWDGTDRTEIVIEKWLGFDEFFLVGFVSMFIYWEMVLYICLEAEKMWGTRRKCVFYIIFSNTTKH